MSDKIQFDPKENQPSEKSFENIGKHGCDNSHEKEELIAKMLTKEMVNIANEKLNELVNLGVIDDLDFAMTCTVRSLATAMSAVFSTIASRKSIPSAQERHDFMETGMNIAIALMKLQAHKMLDTALKKKT